MADKSQDTASVPAAQAYDPFSAMRSEMDRMFNSFLPSGMFTPLARTGFPAATTSGANLMSPRVDIRETDTAISIHAELPGLAEDDVSLEVHDGLLTLAGEKKYESSDEKEHVHTVERSYGRFQRSFRLPESSDENQITATFHKGVLEVTVPKKADAEKTAKKIAIGAK